MPVLLNIYINRDVKVQTIFLIEIVYYLSIFAFEIPSGILGDKYGHDKIVYIGLLGSFITYLFFSVVSGIVAISVIQLFLGFFSSLVSGSDKVQFFKILKSNYDKNSIFIIQKNANIIFVIANLISFLCSGFLMSLDGSGGYVMVGTALGVLLSLGFFILANNSFTQVYSEFEKKNIKEETKFSVRSFIKNKKVFSWCIVSGALLAILGNYYWIIQMYYDYLNFSNQTIGILFMISSLITIIFSKISLFHNGNNKGLVLLFIFPLSYLMMSMQANWIVPLVIILYSIIKIELQPFLENRILELEKHNQSTNMSIVSWINNFIQVFLLLSYSLIFSLLSFKYAVILLGIIIFIIMLFSLKIIVRLRRDVK